MKKTLFIILFILSLLAITQSVQAEINFNFTEFEDNVLNYMTKPYRKYFDEFTWLMIFALVIILAYGISHDVTTTLGAIFITFALFGTTNAFLGNPQYTLFFSIVAALSLAATVYSLYVTKR